MNSESYHNQFSENQRSERYGYHVNEVLIEKEKATEHYDTTWNKQQRQLFIKVLLNQM